MDNKKGITYWRLDPKSHGYDGDVLKNCSLTGGEIDSNFHFLRGYDIKNASWKENTLTLQRLNGEKINVKADLDFLVTASGTTYDKENGVLTLVINDKEYPISGFSTCEQSQIEELWEAISGLSCDTELKFNKVDEQIEDLYDKIKHITVSGVVEDVVVDGKSVVKDRIAKIVLSGKVDKETFETKIEELEEEIKNAGKVKDVTVNGESVLNLSGVAEINLEEYAKEVDLKELEKNVESAITEFEAEDIRLQKEIDDIKEQISGITADIVSLDNDIKITKSGTTTQIQFMGITNPDEIIL